MRRAPVLAALALAFALSAAQAAAGATFCVAKPACSGTSEPDLPSALSAAAASSGRDRIELGSGTIPFGGAATDAAGNPVDIVGAGRAQTTLAATGIVLTMQEPSSTFSDARVSATGTPAALLDLAAGTVQRVDIDATGTDAGASAVGIRLHGGGAVVDDTSIAMATGQNDYALRSDAASGETAPVVRHAIATGLFAVYQTGDGALGIETSDLRGRSAAVRATAGTVTVDDSVVRAVGAVGLSANVASGSPTGATVVAPQVPVLMSTAATGLEAVSNATGQVASVQAVDTVVHGAGTAAAAGGVGGTGTITLDYSSYPFAATT